MRHLDVVVTPDAESDLVEILDYISGVLLVPKVAASYLEVLHEAMLQLSYRGAGIAPVSDEPWHSRGVRRILAKNFYIYFRVDEEESTVYVLNVVYARRDQLEVLKRMREI